MGISVITTLKKPTLERGITPGEEGFGGIARRNDDRVLLRHWNPWKGKEPTCCLGVLPRPKRQWALEHGHTSRNQLCSAIIPKTGTTMQQTNA